MAVLLATEWTIFIPLVCTMACDMSNASGFDCLISYGCQSATCHYVQIEVLS